MKWIPSEPWEIVVVLAATIALVFQLFPLFRNTNKGLENNSASNFVGSEKILYGVKKNGWRLIGVAFVAISAGAGVIQKSVLFGLSICASLNYLLSIVTKDHILNAFGLNRFIAYLISGFYSVGAFLLMILFWSLASQLG